MATRDGRARGPLREEAGRPPRPPAVDKAAPGPQRLRRFEGTHLLQVLGADLTWTSEDGRRAGHWGTMQQERTVRLQYGSRVEAVYVLGTHLWTDVYR